MKKRNEKVLRPLRPNAGLAAEYKRRMLALIEEMATSVEFWLTAAYRKNEPLMAQDEPVVPPQIAATWVGGTRPWIATIDGEPLRTSKMAVIRFGTSEAAVLAARRFAGDLLPADELQAAMNGLADYWLGRFDVASNNLARFFSTSAVRRTDAQLRSILADGGLSVRFQMTPAMSDVLQATIGENVGLIRSIPQQYLKNVEGMVMRSVARGRDLATLTNEIQSQYGVTRRRAALIARDQNNKATSVMHEARRNEIGIQEAVWLHSHGGKKPRPKHVAADGKRYKVGIGLPVGDKGQYVLPGEEINCFPGSTEIQCANFVEVAYRRRFDGELTGLITATGKTLRATPNHPILTPHGWVAAGLLNEGDEIIEISEEGVERAEAEVDANRAPTSLAQIFETLAKTGARDLTRSRSEHFHGDGTTDGDIDVVFAARPLSVGAYTAMSQSLDHLGLTLSTETRSRQSLATQLVSRCARAAAGLVRSMSESLATVGAFPCHSDQARFAAPAHFSAHSLDPGLQRLPLVSGPSTHRKQALAGLVLRAKPERILLIKRSLFSGHVYNLQTKDGWYVAGGVIAHNCRCVSRSIIPGL